MLMLDQPNDRRVTVADARAIPTPEATETYRPIPHGDIIDLVLSTANTTLPLAVADVRVGLAAKGQEMFGVVEFEATDGRPYGLTAGFRNSLNKRVSAGICYGARVTVCSNLCFSGSSITVLRKHTPNVWDTLMADFARATDGAMDHFYDMTQDLDTFRGIQMSEEQVGAALGVMYARRQLRSSEVIKALDYFRCAPHPEHRTGDLFGFYQVVNHALKAASPYRAMDAHAQLHDFAIDLREMDGVWCPPCLPAEAK